MEVAKYFQSPDHNIDGLLSTIQNLLKSSKDIIEVVKEYLENLFGKRRDVNRGHFRKCLQKLHDIYVEVELYKDIIMNHPKCSQERKDAIFKELNCKKDSHERFDMEDETRFPRTISFLHDLDSWGERVKEQYKKVDSLLKELEEETDRMTEIAQGAAMAAKAKKQTTRVLWTAIGVGFGLVTGGAGLGIVAAAGAGLSVGMIASSDDAQDEKAYTESSEKYDVINKETHAANAFTTKTRVFTESAAMTESQAVILRHKRFPHKHPMPLLCDLEQPFVKIFKVLNLDISFGNLKELKMKIDRISQE